MFDNIESFYVPVKIQFNLLTKINMYLLRKLEIYFASETIILVTEVKLLFQIVNMKHLKKFTRERGTGPVGI